MNLLSDIRFAFRLLVKNPGSSAMAILVMAVGTGVAITMFAFVNGVLWSSLGMKESGEIYHLEWSESDQIRNDQMVIPADYEALRAESRSFEHLTAYFGGSASFYNPSGDNLAKQCDWQRVSYNFFDPIQAPMFLGRSFLPEDVASGLDNRIIISHSLWLEQFGGDENAVGAIAMINGKPCTVVGVAKRGFSFPSKADIWNASNWQFAAEKGRKYWFRLNVLGVLKEGLTVKQAKAEISTIAGRLAQAYPETNENLLAMNVRPFTRWYAGDVEKVSYALFGCALLVLGVACANTFNLIMARTATRTTELSIRNALGANRFHVVLQVVLDGLILTSLGAVGGILISGWSLKLIWVQFERGWDVPYWWHMEMDGRVLAFVVGLVLLSSLASSLIPGLRASRTSAAENLKDDSRTSSGLFMGLLSRSILGFQITVTGVLAFVSVLMLLVQKIESSREEPVDPGTILNARVNIQGVGSADAPMSIPDFANTMKERMEAYPGVLGVSYSSLVAGLYNPNKKTFEEDGKVYGSEEAKPKATTAFVGREFDRFMGVEPVVGRGFSAMDTRDSQLVCMLSKRFVDHFWPGEDPIGKRIKVSIENEYRTVVGVMPDFAPKPLPGEDPEESWHLIVYMPRAQLEWGGSITNLLLRSEGDPKQWIEPLRREMRKIAPHLSFTLLGTGEEIYNDAFAIRSVIFTMFGIFGVASLILGVVGLYAVMSFTTRQRFREFGIRMAMGATSSEIIMVVVKRGILLLSLAGVLGLSVGHSVSLFLKRSMDLPDLPMIVTYPLVVIILILGTCFSMGVPAWRASRISPTQALRVE